MVEINAVKFGAFMSRLTAVTGYTFRVYDTQEVASSLVDMCVPQTSVEQVKQVNELMMLMVEGTRKIDTIKVHRQLTGFGLKESKDAVEKYWVSKPMEQPK